MKSAASSWLVRSLSVVPSNIHSQFGAVASSSVRYSNSFNVSCPLGEVAVSPVSFSLLSPVPFFYVARFEYFLLYVSLHSA